MDEQQLEAFEALNHSPEEVSMLARQNGQYLPSWPHSFPLHSWLSEQAHLTRLVVKTVVIETEDVLEALADEQPHLVCPLSRAVFRDPVVWADGFTYENAYLEKWLAKSDTSPLTRKKYDSKQSLPNLVIKQLVDAAVESKKAQMQLGMGALRNQ